VDSSCVWNAAQNRGIGGPMIENSSYEHRKPYTRERQVPTWVVGLPAADGRAEVVQLWPARTAAEQLTVAAFNARIEPLRQRHCDLTE
jgi:hypothetical protein